MGDQYDACIGDISGFLAIAAAPGHSQLSGVMAAVVFTGMILLLSDRTSDATVPSARRNALVMMVPTFFGLVIASFAFAVTMGETNCRRADAATISIAGLFAVSAVGMMYALAWLFDAYEKGFKTLTKLSGSMVFIISAMAFGQMGLTVVDFQDKYQNDLISNTLIWIYTGIAVVLIAAGWLRWFRRSSAKEGSSTGSAVAIVVYSLFAIPLFDLIVNVPVSKWNGAAAPVHADIAYIANLIGIAAPIYLMLRTTPHSIDDSIESDKPSKDKREKAIPQAVAPDLNTATESDASERQINAREDGQVSQPASP